MRDSSDISDTIRYNPLSFVGVPPADPDVTPPTIGNKLHTLLFATAMCRHITPNEIFIVVLLVLNRIGSLRFLDLFAHFAD